MVTKAVEFQLVEGLTTTAFLSAFTRFNSMKGPCFEIWSDNGRNFVGSERVLSSMVPLGWRTERIIKEVFGRRWSSQ